jgi:hypothetical protein
MQAMDTDMTRVSSSTCWPLQRAEAPEMCVWELMITQARDHSGS